jgi:hypothetical protein
MLTLPDLRNVDTPRPAQHKHFPTCAISDLKSFKDVKIGEKIETRAKYLIA